nr:vegetative cell wall protein gp1-like [Aegilops tauschii subsp. strangulata]
MATRNLFDQFILLHKDYVRASPSTPTAAFGATTALRRPLPSPASLDALTPRPPPRPPRLDLGRTPGAPDAVAAHRLCLIPPLLRRRHPVAAGPRRPRPQPRRPRTSLPSPDSSSPSSPGCLLHAAVVLVYLPEPRCPGPYPPRCEARPPPPLSPAPHARSDHRLAPPLAALAPPRYCCPAVRARTTPPLPTAATSVAAAARSLPRLCSGQAAARRRGLAGAHAPAPAPFRPRRPWPRPPPATRPCPPEATASPPMGACNRALDPHP